MAALAKSCSGLDHEFGLKFFASWSRDRFFLYLTEKPYILVLLDYSFEIEGGASYTVWKYMQTSIDFSGGCSVEGLAMNDAFVLDCAVAVVSTDDELFLNTVVWKC
jgi:hypothetical protein